MKTSLSLGTSGTLSLRRYSEKRKESFFTFEEQILVKY